LLSSEQILKGKLEYKVEAIEEGLRIDVVPKDPENLSGPVESLQGVLRDGSF
jgi:hypothetical protein